MIRIVYLVLSVYRVHLPRSIICDRVIAIQAKRCDIMRPNPVVSYLNFTSKLNVEPGDNFQSLELSSFLSSKYEGSHEHIGSN
jgi:hypothetical protein